MALEIKAIPTLRGDEGLRFVEKADAAFKNRGTVDFSKEKAEAREILKKARL